MFKKADLFLGRLFSLYLCMAYEIKIKLKDNEKVWISDQETAEIKECKVRPNNIPEGKVLFEPSAHFMKDYRNSWRFLKQVLKPIEYMAAHSLALKAKSNTNSLEPLNDETTLKELMAELNVSINKVKPILRVLFDLGVYGRFETAKPDVPYTKYWILNPYLTLSSKLTHSDIAELFKGTHVEKAFRDPEYILTYKSVYKRIRGAKN